MMTWIGANTATYHLTDALGSARGMTDGTGALVGTADYAAFGAVRSSSGAGSVFGYTGEQTDATGLTYLRARYLDPSLGRFLSMDTVQPNAPGTQGYNRCAYVANNPVTWTDPSGNITAGDACTWGVNQWVNFQLRRWLASTAAWGWIFGKHPKGTFAIFVSAALVMVGAAAEHVVGPNMAVRVGEAIAGGILISNSLAISMWAFGDSHLSIVAAGAILLAGVLLLLLGAILGILGGWFDWALGLYQVYSPGGIACRGIDLSEPAPMNRGSQSPDGTDGALIRGRTDHTPETPTRQIDLQRPVVPVPIVAR